MAEAGRIPWVSLETITARRRFVTAAADGDLRARLQLAEAVLEHAVPAAGSRRVAGVACRAVRATPRLMRPAAHLRCKVWYRM